MVAGHLESETVNTNTKASTVLQAHKKEKTEGKTASPAKWLFLVGIESGGNNLCRGGWACLKPNATCVSNANHSFD